LFELIFFIILPEALTEDVNYTREFPLFAMNFFPAKKFPRNLPCPSTLGPDSFLDERHRSRVGIFRARLNPPPPSAPKDVMDEIYKIVVAETIQAKRITGEKMVHAEIWGAIIVAVIAAEQNVLVHKRNTHCVYMDLKCFWCILFGTHFLLAKRCL
jgi:hypothetical protein